MKTYVLTVEIDDNDSDEWWDAVHLMKARDARKEVAAEVSRCMADHGFVKPGCRVHAILTRRS